MKKVSNELKVLIIDDELDIRERLSSILQRRGYLVYTAEDGLEGLSIAVDNRVEIIITDIFMPRMNGIELLKKVREIDLKAEIIIVSGNPSIELRAEVFDEDAIDYLIKPLTVDDILKSLAKAEKRIFEKEAISKN